MIRQSPLFISSMSGGGKRHRISTGDAAPQVKNGFNQIPSLLSEVVGERGGWQGEERGLSPHPSLSHPHVDTHTHVHERALTHTRKDKDDRRRGGVDGRISTPPLMWPPRFPGSDDTG